MSKIKTLCNCTILTIDAKDSFYPDGRIVIEDDIIKQIGGAEDIAVQAEKVDLGGALVMPGMINTHTHSHSSIFRSLADDLELMDWLKKAIWPMEGLLSKECMYAATSLSCLEYLKSGITTIADQIYYADTVAQATSKSGIRSFLAASVFSGKGPAPETGNTFLDAQRFVEQWQGLEEKTRIYPCIGPHAPYSVDDELFREIVKYAQKKDLIIHVHISETQDENNQILKRTGKTPTALLESLGVFSCPVISAHSIHLNNNDIAIFAKNNVAVSYNPISNLKLVSGIMPLKEMWKSGITVSLGTDGAQSNNSMDLLADLRVASLLQKQYTCDATFCAAREAIRMVTIEGAKALRFENKIGSLEVGKKADIISFDVKSPRLNPIHKNNLNNLYSLVVYSASGNDINNVMIDGEWIIRDKNLLRLNQDEVFINAQEASEYILAGKDKI